MKRRLATLSAAVALLGGATACGVVQDQLEKRAQEEVEKGRQRIEKEVEEQIGEQRTQIEKEVEKGRQQVEEKVREEQQRAREGQ